MATSSRTRPPRAKNTTGRDIVIVDMDGTIADATRREREFLLKPRKKNWPGFFRDMELDPPIPAIFNHVMKLSRKYDIIILTGRPEKYRPQTERWLKKHKVPAERVLMRRKGDSRPDYEAKTDLLRELKESLLGRKIVLALDDREPVCAEYTKLGVKCIPVASSAANQLINEAYREMAG